VKQHKRTMPKEFELLPTSKPMKKKKLQSLKDIWCKKLKEAAMLMLANSILPDIKRRRTPPCDAPKLTTTILTPVPSIQKAHSGTSTPSSKRVSKEQLKLKLTPNDESSVTAGTVGMDTDSILSAISLDSSWTSTSSSSSAPPFEAQMREMRKSAARKLSPTKSQKAGSKVSANKKRKSTVGKSKPRKRLKVEKSSSLKSRPLKRSTGGKGPSATKRRRTPKGGKRKKNDKSVSLLNVPIPLPSSQRLLPLKSWRSEHFRAALLAHPFSKEASKECKQRWIAFVEALIDKVSDDSDSDLSMETEEQREFHPLDLLNFSASECLDVGFDKNGLQTCRVSKSEILRTSAVMKSLWNRARKTLSKQVAKEKVSKNRTLDTQAKRTEPPGDLGDECLRTSGFRPTTNKVVKPIPFETTGQRPKKAIKTAIPSASRVRRSTDRSKDTLGKIGSRRGRRVAHRRFQANVADLCSLSLKSNSLRARKKNLKFGKSRIHTWGVFANEDIPKDEMVVEYIGEYIAHDIADKRQSLYFQQNIDDYMFRVDEFLVIDATRKGNVARFINHSCDPNCFTKVMRVDRKPRVVIYSKRNIKMGTELTYDYKFPIEENKIPCTCGAQKCRLFLN